MKILDEAGRVQPHEGKSTRELLYTGLQRVRGYFDDAEANAAPIETHRWFHSGDVATIDSDGFMESPIAAKISSTPEPNG
jgi:long-subunit acyl-CoA synthetase (AMP-forming)